MILPAMNEKHEYYIGKKRIYSVSQILVKAGIIDTTFFSDYACERGTMVHEILHLHDIDDLNENAVKPLIVPYLEQWKKFKEVSGLQVLKSEKKVYSPKYNYCGTYDKFGLMNGLAVLVDVKTGSAQPWHSLQLAAYRQALIECGGPKCLRFTLELGPEDFKLRQHKNSDDFSKFVAALKGVSNANCNTGDSPDGSMSMRMRTKNKNNTGILQK